MEIRLGKPLEIVGIKNGRLVRFGGFVFNVPEEYMQIEAVKHPERVSVYAYDVNKLIGKFLGSFESVEGDVLNSRSEIN